MRVQIAELHRYDQQTVWLQGWIEARRHGGKIVFLMVRDGTGRCQCIVEAARQDAFATALALGLEASVRVRGAVHADARSTGGYELQVQELDLIGASEEYPIARQSHGVDFLFSHRHLWLRAQRTSTLLRIRHTVIKTCREFFDNRGFTLIDTPLLTSGAGEDAQTLFSVEYFDQTASLAQTGQLYLESACMALGKVYCFGPTFRAEKSKTRRHLTEFWMIEPEVAFAELDDLLLLAEELICALVQAVLDRHTPDLERLGRSVAPLRRICPPFPRITYTEAVELLRSSATAERLRAQLAQEEQLVQTLRASLQEKEAEHQAAAKAWKKDRLQAAMLALRDDLQEHERRVANLPRHLELAQNFRWGKDLGGSDETILSEGFDCPLFVTDYPKEAKAFYMKRTSSSARTVRNMDLLAPEGYGEIIGGSQREENLDLLLAAMREKGLDPEAYNWYLDLRRYGTVPHGGFGLGIERALSWFCGLRHVREAIPFPRTMGRMAP